MVTSVHARLLVLGSGPAGCTAALYAARANLKPTMITGEATGGQLTTTTEVDNWPGDAQGVLGPLLMDRLISHAERFKTNIVKDHIAHVNLAIRPFVLTGIEATYTCDALVVATGATARYLGLPSEREFLGRGVSGCATCDGFFYQGQDVCVVGGGNTAVQETLYLSNICHKVILVHRRTHFRAEPVLLEQLMARIAEGKVELRLDCLLQEVVGDEHGVNAVRLTGVSGDSGCTIPVNGVFVAIGHDPNTGLMKDQLDMREGYILTGGNLGATATSVAGVFAAGDVQDSIYRQAITSAGTGCMAALDAQRYLESLA